MFYFNNYRDDNIIYLLYNSNNNNIMNRNKIERWILSQDHTKHPNLIFGLTIFCVFIIITSMLLYIKYSQ